MLYIVIDLFNAKVGIFLQGNLIKQYGSTVYVGITPKIAAQKKQPKSILCDKKYLYQTALTLLNPDIVHKTMQQL